MAIAYRIGLVLLLFAGVSCGDGTNVEQSTRPCLHNDVAVVLEADYVITDEAEITKHEALSARYQPMPGVRAVVASRTGGTYVVADEEAGEALAQAAQVDGLTLVRSCVSATDLGVAQAMKLDLGKDDYLTVSYLVFSDEIGVMTNRPLDEVLAALDKAGIRSPVAISGADPGDIVRRGGWASD